MLQIKHIITLLAVPLILSGCLKDKTDDLKYSAAGIQIPLSLGEMKVVEIRSVASNNERLIEDAYVLVFAPNGTYVDGEKVNVSTDIANNGQQKPILTTKVILDNGNTVLVLANTGVGTMPSITNISQINTAFPSINWDINRLDEGQYMPMSGTMIYGTDTECQLVRACAKTCLDMEGDDWYVPTYNESIILVDDKCYQGSSTACTPIFSIGLRTRQEVLSMAPKCRIGTLLIN